MMQEQSGRNSPTINLKESIQLSPKLTPVQDANEWENIYLYSTPLFGNNLVKLCASSQSVTKFKERTSKFYPNPITMHLIGIHPISKRTELTLHLDKYRASDENNGFYTNSCIPILNEYLNLILASPELSSLQTELSIQFDKLCKPSVIGNVKKSDVIERILSTSDITVSHLLVNTLLSQIMANINYQWRQDTLDIYHSFIKFYISKLQRQCDNQSVFDVRFAGVLIAARKWFVFEEKQNGHKIPHKAARRTILEKLLTEKYGIPERATGKGLKDSIWKVENKA